MSSSYTLSIHEVSSIDCILLVPVGLRLLHGVPAVLTSGAEEAGGGEQGGVEGGRAEGHRGPRGLQVALIRNEQRNYIKLKIFNLNLIRDNILNIMLVMC